MSAKHNDDKGTGERDRGKETELRRETRRQRAIERLGTQNPRCINCPEDDPLVLEKHHLEGQAFGGSVVIICRNCHRKLSDRQKDHPEKIADLADAREVIAHFLLGLADLFESLIEKFREFAAQLIERADPNRDNVEPGGP